jgi:integrase
MDDSRHPYPVRLIARCRRATPGAHGLRRRLGGLRSRDLLVLGPPRGGLFLCGRGAPLRFQHRVADAVERVSVAPRVDSLLVFPAAQGGYIGLDSWRTREWYPALEAAGIGQRGPYCLRHTFATEALAAGISTFELSRLMGTSIAMIDRTYGHLARDSEDAIRARLNARSDRSGVDLASE